MKTEITIVKHPCPKCGKPTKFMQPSKDKRCWKCQEQER